MKKIILLLLGVLFFVNMQAQKFGVKAGADLATITTTPSADHGIQPGLNGAVFIQKGIFPMISLRPTLGYYQKGYTASLLGIDYVNTINYVQFDLDLRIKPPFIPIYAIAGPYAAYAISGATSTNGISIATTFNKNQINNLDYGFSVGLGYQQNLAIAKLFFELVYNYGMFDYDGSSSFARFNRNLSLDLGIMIGL